MLGLALACRDNLHAMHEELGGTRDYVAVGGGAASAPLLQLISDVAGVTQSVPKRTIGAALGDARLAAEALGWKDPPKNGIRSITRSAHPSIPARYDAMFTRFKELHRATRHLEVPGGRL